MDLKIFTDFWREVIFLVALKCKKFKNVSCPVKNFISSQKFCDIPRKFSNILRNEILRIKKYYFAKYEINILRIVRGTRWYWHNPYEAYGRFHRGGIIQGVLLNTMTPWKTPRNFMGEWGNRIRIIPLLSSMKSGNTINYRTGDSGGIH
jgi:hypothetical protein